MHEGQQEKAEQGIWPIKTPLILGHGGRCILHVKVTGHPTVYWNAQQMIDAFPFDSALNYVIRDRDSIYGSTFRIRVANMGIDQVLIAPRSPWQNPYVERVIGSICRECLNHVIIINERHLRKILRAYLECYHGSRTHLSLVKDSTDPRSVSVENGNVVPFPKVGDLHHRYERLAA